MAQILLYIFVCSVVLNKKKEEKMKKMLSAVLLAALITISLNAQTPSTSTWPMFRHDLIHSGRSPVHGELDSIGKMWKNPYTYNKVETSPAIEDIDDDGDLDVIVGVSTSASELDYVAAYDGATGDTLWIFNFDNTNLMAFSSPAVADIDDDGDLDVVIGATGGGHGRVYAIDGPTGTLIWVDTTYSNLVKSSPAIGDVDGDGDLEVVIGVGREVYAYDAATGDTLWTYHYLYGGYFTSSPALANVDGYPGLETFIGDSHGNVYCITGQHGWAKWITTVPGQILYSSPSVADIVSGYPNTGAEVIIGSTDSSVWVFRAINGDYVWDTKTEGVIVSSPAVWDICGNYKKEVIIGSDDHRVWVLAGQTGDSIWTYMTGDSVRSSPAIADIDNDGDEEVIVNSWDNYIYALNGTDGSLLWRYDITARFSSPSVGDLDGDGWAEIATGSNMGVWALDLPPDIDLSVNSLNYGDVFVNDSSVKSFYIRNIGECRLEIDSLNNSLSIFWTDSPVFPQNIEKGESLEVVVYFKPSSISDFNDTISIYNNDPDEAVVHVFLTGSGVANSVEEEFIDTNSDLSVWLNSSNPFKGRAEISFSLPENTKVNIEIYNIAGQKISTLFDNELNAGLHSVVWDGRNARGEQIQNGVYFYKFEALNRRIIKEMILLR